MADVATRSRRSQFTRPSCACRLTTYLGSGFAGAGRSRNWSLQKVATCQYYRNFENAALQRENLRCAGNNGFPLPVRVCHRSNLIWTIARLWGATLGSLYVSTICTVRFVGESAKPSRNRVRHDPSPEVRVAGNVDISCFGTRRALSFALRLAPSSLADSLKVLGANGRAWSLAMGRRAELFGFPMAG